MLNLINKFYFYGEFGYLNFSILGAFAKLPSRKIEISTYPDYLALFQKINPQVIAGQTADYSKIRDTAREGYKLKDADFTAELEAKGYRSLADFLGCGHKRLVDLTTPFGTTQPKKYLSISCRKRIHDPKRNMSEAQWQTIVEIVRSIKPFDGMPIVFHGTKEESLELSVENSIYAADMDHAIETLNGSAVFIASMSGYAQFASNCACDVIQLGPPKKHINYSPFKTRNVCVERSTDFIDTASFTKTIQEIADEINQQNITN